MFKLFFSVLIAVVFCGNAFAQNLPATHRIILGNKTHLVKIKNWKQGEIEYTKSCSEQVGCVENSETHSYATRKISGQSYEVHKRNMTGQRLYHNLLGQTIAWQVYQNSKLVGSWDISFIRTLPDGSRVYKEKFNISGDYGSSITKIHGVTVMYQDGEINGVAFSLQKL